MKETVRPRPASEAAVRYLAQLPRPVLIVAVLAVLLAGLFAPGLPGAAALVVITGFLSWLTWMSWSVTLPSGRLGRLMLAGGLLLFATAKLV